MKWEKNLAQLANPNSSALEDQDFQRLHDNTESNWNSSEMDELIANAQTLLGSNIIFINLHEITDKNNQKQKIKNLNLLLLPQSLQENGPPIMIPIPTDRRLVFIEQIHDRPREIMDPLPRSKGQDEGNKANGNSYNWHKSDKT